MIETETPVPATPEPSADHCVPSHFAMRLAGTPPTSVNRPPM